jgi:hypothetical protein
MELFTTHHLGTPIALPWKAETKEEEEKQVRPVVEEFKFISPELQITDEQGKLSKSVKQDGVKVQNVDFISNLPTYIKNLLQTKKQFKWALKEFLHFHSFYTLNDFYNYNT